MTEIRYGGVLKPGDFIAISSGNSIDLGWYCGKGRNTLQYYHFRGPGMYMAQWEEWSKMTDEAKSKSWNHKKYAKGFTIKCLWKSYINAVHSTRIMKVTNIEDVFTQPEDLLEYEKSKEALLTLNFIKK
jgi:hypothetical protein